MQLKSEKENSPTWKPSWPFVHHKLKQITLNQSKSDPSQTGRRASQPLPARRARRRGSSHARRVWGLHRPSSAKRARAGPALPALLPLQREGARAGPAALSRAAPAALYRASHPAARITRRPLPREPRGRAPRTHRPCRAQGLPPPCARGRLQWIRENKERTDW